MSCTTDPGCIHPFSLTFKWCVLTLFFSLLGSFCPRYAPIPFFLVPHALLSFQSHANNSPPFFLFLLFFFIFFPFLHANSFSYSFPILIRLLPSVSFLLMRLLHSYVPEAYLTYALSISLLISKLSRFSGPTPSNAPFWPL